MPEDVYKNPLIERYCSPQMSQHWGPQKRFATWRRVWIALAEAEHELGLPISAAQINELRSAANDIDFEAARQYERQLRHDVMAHVHAYGDQCPGARGIIHLGATSCFVTDNADLILLKEALALTAQRVAATVLALADFANDHKALPTLAYTHLQPAQPTTVGKRATLWAYDLVLDLYELEHRLQQLRARSIKGTTGTQASFLQLFDGDGEKVRKLETLVAEKLGFDQCYEACGQTYPRKIDHQILSALSGLGASSHKAASDLRLLASFKEIEEPFEEHQIGSSAMAYKRNPMRAERICALARYLMSLDGNASATHAVQWMERTLDDSANRRIVLPQAFLAADAILNLYQNIAAGMVVYPQVIARRLAEELPFMITENVLMQATAAGGDRQDLHERIRQHSVASAREVKEEGRPNDLLERLKTDDAFAGVNIDAAADSSSLTGRSEAQVEEFLGQVIEPIRERYADAAEVTGEVHV